MEILDKFVSPEAKEKRPRAFSDLRLEQVKLCATPEDHLNNYTHRDGTVIERLSGSETVDYEGVPVKVSVMNDRRNPPGKSLQTEAFRVALGESGAEIKMMADFIYGTNGTGTVDTQIIRQDPKNTLPKGLGIAAYQKLLDLIESVAKTKKMPITNNVSMVTGLSPTPMTAEKWESIFVPILNERGYIRLDKKHWEKTYQP